MKRTVSRAAGAVLATMAGVLVVVGCSSGTDAAPRVAGTGTGTVKPQDEGAIKQAWVQCMHEAGQTSVQVNKQGQVEWPAAGAGEAGSGSAADAGAAAMEKAMTACDAKVPGMRQIADKDLPKMVERARQLAVCLRNNELTIGQVPDPDAKFGGNVAIAVDIDPAAFERAYAVCGKDFQDVGVTSLGKEGR
ncbi:hypothetical protein ACIRRH_33775 [Kitasatospora sp. NPDC101235]|uniref:hypothetical protein n=1 Tax=Kitasatospora sp. NPDC101235 TaxID=3364101 RepID=UPI0037FB0F7B